MSDDPRSFFMHTPSGYTLHVTRNDGKNWLKITGPYRNFIVVLLSDEELQQLRANLEAVLQ